jgi:hypothetical protein
MRTASTMNWPEMAVFWDVTPCNLMYVGQVGTHHVIGCYIPEDSHLHTGRSENLKSR